MTPAERRALVHRVRDLLYNVPERSTFAVASDTGVHRHGEVRDLLTLLAEVEELAKDAERLDWLAEQASKRGPVESYNVESPPLVAAIAFDTIHTLREAIDAARAASPEGEGT